MIAGVQEPGDKDPESSADALDPDRSPIAGAESGDDGVDVTLIRWLLSLSPDERLDVLTQQARAIEDMRDGARIL